MVMGKKPGGVVRGFGRVDEDGKILIPDNIRRQAEFSPGQLVEIKVQGPKQGQWLIIHKRKSAR